MRKRGATRELALISLLGALIVACAFISIPFLSIPVTMQLFGIYFALFTLGGRAGSASVVLYVAIGVLGLPVFSGFSGGIGRLFDATGGFIIGFILLALSYWLFSAVLPKTRGGRICSAVIGSLVLYLVGALWYAVVYLGGVVHFTSAVLYTVLPFVIFDAVKLILALICSDLLKKQLHITN